MINEFKDLNRFKGELEGWVTDSIVEEVRADLKSRSEVGIKKYGVTLDREDVSKSEWAVHAYHEALDLALYLKRLIKELK